MSLRGRALGFPRVYIFLFCAHRKRYYLLSVPTTRNSMDMTRCSEGAPSGKLTKDSYPVTPVSDTTHKGQGISAKVWLWPLPQDAGVMIWPVLCITLWHDRIAASNHPWIQTNHFLEVESGHSQVFMLVRIQAWMIDIKTRSNSMTLSYIFIVPDLDGVARNTKTHLL